MIDGTKSAEQVFVEFLSSIADALIDTAKQMIAQYIAIGIARMFAGMGGSVPTDAGGWATSFATPQPGIGTGFNFDAGAMTGGMPWSFGGAMAKGGPVSSGQTYMVGERGPELFVPGRSGTIVANDKMGGGSTNVVVNVDAKGSSVEGNEQGANQLGRVISAAVQSELIKQQRPGGILAR
jgi:phage-related minor tail protein